MSAPTRFETEVWIDAAPDTVFAYFTDPELFVRWQGTEAEFEARPGGRYRVVYGETVVISGEFVEVDAPTRVVYRRRIEGVADAGHSLVEIDLAPERGGTRVTVLHTEFAPDEGVEWGWQHFLGRLQERLAA